LMRSRSGSRASPRAAALRSSSTTRTRALAPRVRVARRCRQEAPPAASRTASQPALQ
jgi:hypothetical protein